MESSTVRVADVKVAAVVTCTVTMPLLILPPTESWVKIEKPVTKEVEIGFLKFVTLKATSIPPSMLLETAPVTIRTEFEKEHCSELESTAKVEQDVTP